MSRKLRRRNKKWKKSRSFGSKWGKLCQKKNVEKVSARWEFVQSPRKWNWAVGLLAAHFCITLHSRNIFWFRVVSKFHNDLLNREFRSQFYQWYLLRLISFVTLIFNNPILYLGKRKVTTLGNGLLFQLKLIGFAISAYLSGMTILFGFPESADVPLGLVFVCEKNS